MKILRKKSGFTLIETMVVIGIFVLLVGGVTAFFAYLYRQQGSDVAKIENISAASRVLETMSNEIRKMNRAEDGTFPLEFAQAQTLIFYSDVDGDGLTEKIEYSLDGTNLERKLTEPGGSLDYSGEAVTTIMLEGVRNGADPLFKYYDESYTGTQDPLAEPVNVTEVRLVEINLKVNVNENQAVSFTLETKVHPRNLKNFN